MHVGRGTQPGCLVSVLGDTSGACVGLFGTWERFLIVLICVFVFAYAKKPVFS